MTKMDLSNSQSQGDACATACQQLATQLGELTSATTLFNDSDFKGKAATKAKAFVSSVFVPFIKAAVMLTSAVGKDVKKLPAKYISSVANKSWSTEELEQKIQDIQSQIKATDNLLNTLSHYHDSDHSHTIGNIKNNAETRKGAYQSQLKKYQEILRKFNNFNDVSPQIFTNLSSLKAAFQQGAQQVQNCKKGNFAIPADIGWTRTINSEWQDFCTKELSTSFKKSLVTSLDKSKAKGATILAREFGLGLENSQYHFLKQRYYHHNGKDVILVGDINDKNKPLIRTGRAFDKIGEFGGRALRDISFITDLGNFTNDYLNKHNNAAAKDLTNFTTSMLVGAVGDAVTGWIVGELSFTLGPELLIGLGVGAIINTAYNAFYNNNLLETKTNIDKVTNDFKYEIKITQDNASKLVNNVKDMIHAEDCKLWN